MSNRVKDVMAEVKEFLSTKTIDAMIGPVVFALIIAYTTKNANNYLIPKLLSSGILLIVTLISLVMDRPLASLVSRFFRGWPIAWFQRNDIKPAYREVTIFWAVLLLIRLIVLFTLYKGGDLLQLLWGNLFLGTPSTILILSASYIYGIWRLNTLNGPSIEEFLTGKEPPYKGQKKGF